MFSQWFNYTSCERIEGADATGINPGWWLYHRSRAKSVSTNPYLLANEWICGSLALALRLQIPPMAIMRRSASSQRFFASLDYSVGETTATDMDPVAFCSSQLSVATGIVLFDMLIANADRHEGNLKVDNPHNPQRFHIIDHEQALLGYQKGKGGQRLTLLLNDLGYRKLSSEYQHHKLGVVIASSAHFWDWANRIYTIPDSFIHEICSESEGLGLLTSEAEQCESFLKYRKSNLVEIIKRNKKFFVNIKDWGLVW